MPRDREYVCVHCTRTTKQKISPINKFCVIEKENKYKDYHVIPILNDAI